VITLFGKMIHVLAVSRAGSSYTYLAIRLVTRMRTMAYG